MLNLETSKTYLLPFISDELIRYEIVDSKIKVISKNTDIIRELAKRPKVKMRWAVCKDTGTPMFAGPVVDWNELQVYLVYWLSFYTGIEGAYERPPDRVLANNALLDKWIEKRGKELDEQHEISWAKDSSGISKSAYDSDEVYEL